MLPDGAIRAEHVWKRFRPGRQRSLLRDELARLRERRSSASPYWSWVLRDVCFDLEPGSAFALIGSNGSGKSTMLKILTRVMYPYSGSVEVRGRVGALIEVAAGIHPDLTGRENCYLYGSLLGLSRADVTRRFDDIVEFAELHDAIDRQVKFYSSGMKMRLGFGVAAYLEPHVLLVDEVLSVGDAAFQQRCLNRMREVLAGGTTLVYVSHDLPTVESMCTTGLWLYRGVTQSHGAIRDVLTDYRQWVEETADIEARHDGPVQVSGCKVTGADGPPTTMAPLVVDVELESDVDRDVVVHLGITQGPATPIISLQQPVALRSGNQTLRCTLPEPPLPRGRFTVWLAALDGGPRDVMPWQPAGTFDMTGPDLQPTPRGVVRLAPVYSEASWEGDGV